MSAQIIDLAEYRRKREVPPQESTYDPLVHPKAVMIYVAYVLKSLDPSKKDCTGGSWVQARSFNDARKIIEERFENDGDYELDIQQISYASGTN